MQPEQNVIHIYFHTKYIPKYVNTFLFHKIIDEKNITYYIQNIYIKNEQLSKI